MKSIKYLSKWAFILIFLFLNACKIENSDENTFFSTKKNNSIEDLLNKYVEVTLTTDITKLSEEEKQIIGLLIDASQIMDELFWYEAYGGKETFLSSIEDEQLKKFATINYGAWDRLDNNTPFINGIGEKPLGANFYPVGITKEEFEASSLSDEEKKSLYTFIRRDDADLVAVPYHKQFEIQMEEAANLLINAAEITDNKAFKKYLTLRAQALLTDEYRESDMAWMDMKDNHLDVVIGPIETYEDQLYGYKAAHEAYVLIKDMEWSSKLAKYAAFLPELQRGLPVSDAYKAEKPGADADLNAYDVVYYAGDCNSGSKTIAINLPNDEIVQEKKGSRRLQLKNAMQAKFEKILLPIANTLIVQEQRKHITFDAFFANTMFHEVAHGLGIKNTINQKGLVREALKEHAAALEEGKADVVGLYMVKKLHEKGELKGDINDYYVTFMAGIFRSVRFGAASAHGKANMIRFNYFQEKGAFERDEKTGCYRIDFEKFDVAVNELSKLILTLQGDGNYEGVAKLVAEKAVIGEVLQKDLDKLGSKNIPVDVVFKQGKAVLGL